MNDNQIVAKTILKQIGNRALFMLGALQPKSMLALDNGVIFKVGRNSHRINKIKITLNALDLYNVEYWYNALNHKTWEDKSKLVGKSENIYADMLTADIATKTGLNIQL